MQITLEKNGHSTIRIRNNESKLFKTKVEELMEEFGGEEIKRSSRYTYYRIYKDILNGKGAM